MSRAGRAHGPTAKKREVIARVQEAAAAHDAGAAPVGVENPTVEMPPHVLAQWKAQQLHIRCKAMIVARDRALWPGETIGAAIAETWMQQLLMAMQQQAATAARQGDDVRERAAASGLVVPG